jgi:hypothetical protein
MTSQMEAPVAANIRGWVPYDSFKQPGMALALWSILGLFGDSTLKAVIAPMADQLIVLITLKRVAHSSPATSDTWQIEIHYRALNGSYSGESVVRGGKESDLKRLISRLDAMCCAEEEFLFTNKTKTECYWKQFCEKA